MVKKVLIMVTVLAVVLLIPACLGSDAERIFSRISVSLDGGGDTNYSFPGAIGFYSTTENLPVPANAGIVWGIDAQQSSVLVTFVGDTADTYSISTDEATILYSDGQGNIYAATNILFGTGTVTVTTMEDVGGKIVGSFDVTAFQVEGDDPGSFATISGTFNVVREVDDYTIGN